MKRKKIVRTIVLALVFIVLVQAVTPLVRAAETARSCEAALNRCLFVASFLVTPVYDLFCFEGYFFCKKYLE